MAVDASSRRSSSGAVSMNDQFDVYAEQPLKRFDLAARLLPMLAQRDVILIGSCSR